MTLGLPLHDELEKALKNLRNEVKVVLIENRKKKSNNLYKKIINEVHTKAKDKIKSLSLPLNKAKDYDIPSTPALIIYGIFNGRLRFIGLMDELMEYMVKLSIAYAGKGLELKDATKIVKTSRLTIDLYVVPGIPCLKTLKALLPLPACHNIILNVIDVRENKELAVRYPGSGLPLTVVRESNYVKRGIISDISQVIKKH